MEQTVRFRARKPMSNLNQVEWYISKMSRVERRLNSSGLILRANSTASSRWGTNVPMTEARARMMRRMMVSLTELKKAQTGFLLCCGSWSFISFLTAHERVPDKDQHWTKKIV